MLQGILQDSANSENTEQTLVMVTNSACALVISMLFMLCCEKSHTVIHAGAQWLAQFLHPPVLQATR